MQLIIISLAFFLIVLTNTLKAQVQSRTSDRDQDSNQNDSTKTEMADYEDPNWRNVDIDFLSSYYEQDGDNSAVTGGIGTEQLSDFTQKVIMKIPLGPRLNLKMDGGYDYYSSASTDKIDPVKSDDSASDMRVHGNVGITWQKDKRQSVGFRLGGSTEYDYNSSQFGINYNWLAKDKNTAINFQAQAFIDAWKIIYPKELRGGSWVTTNLRQSYNAAIGISRVLDKKTQVSLQVEATFMNGLLSTPFHRVYFIGETAARVEKLPSQRLKIPVGIRLNRYVTDWLVARMYYRFYWDDWGVTAHTASLELPIKINRFFSIAPYYRFHMQTEAQYFQPYKMHDVQSEFYTSDYDLSALTSHSIGVALNYQPAGGIAKVKLPYFKDSYFKVKSVDVKYSHYLRNTGLSANIISAGIGFTIERPQKKGRK